jgi:hypothetical protein
MKTENEVVAALSTRYDGPTKDMDGFTYIPWPEVVRKLDDLFGPTNWSSEPISFTADAAHGIYTGALNEWFSGRPMVDGHELATNYKDLGSTVRALKSK